MAKKIKEPTLVVGIEDNCVQFAKLFTNNKKAEECFAIEAQNVGARNDDIEASLDDGCYEGTNGRTICIVHPEVL